MFTQIRNASRYTPDGQNEIIAPVTHLLPGGRPSAIARLIVAVVVWVTVDALASRALAHIGQEVLELQPPLEDFYSSPAVVPELGGVRVVASGNHPAPRIISPCLAGSRVAMGEVILGRNATTRPCMETSEAVVADDFCPSALAQTKTVATGLTGWPPSCFRLRNYFELSKGESDDTDFVRHDSELSFIVVFSGCGSGETDRSHDSIHKSLENQAVFS